METYLDGPVTLAQLNHGVWCRPDHAAVALGVDERTIRRRVRSGAFARTTIAGRVYVRQAPEQAQATPEPERERREEVSSTLALVVREQAGRLEQLARELTLAQVEASRLEATSEQARTRAERLELELAQAREQSEAQARELSARARQVEEQLAQAREQASREQARAERLEALANAPWYAVRVRRQLRRELVSA